LNRLTEPSVDSRTITVLAIALINRVKLTLDVSVRAMPTGQTVR